ncbi:hypothetical protein Ais01nite_60830 [Asanoa ishikariensis]|uniref:DUF2567 domain-containing protein n=1 Tax=Asanoa ishikariensis TaxID=137265 RepID=A0A1H3P7P9_9ACTN|nr:DUF2567 domain-containing protein [Asanoa ishikariensis]GIF68048.1 hypothetical protein Ais01nite_60830 [Asanoa ishikariensis]SDY97070.1 Protein of unknown function [Asanoa ishikariensis]
MTAASPEPTDGSGATPATGDGTWTRAGSLPADPLASPSPDPAGGGSAAFGSFAQLDPPDAGRASGAGPWSTPPTGWQPPSPVEVGVPGADVAYGPSAPPTPRMPLRQRLGAAGLTVAVVAVIGAPLGLLWALIAPGVPIIKTEDGAVFATPSPEEFIASDGWFTILLFSLGVVAALVTWIGFKRHRGPLTLAALVVGTIGASILAWQVGRRIGSGDYHDKVLAAQPGDLLVRPPDLRAGGFTKLWDVVPFVHGDLLIATFGAVIIYTLLAGWSRTPTLRPEPALPQPAVPSNPYYSLAGPSETAAAGWPGQPATEPGGPAQPGGSGWQGGPADPGDPAAPPR